MRALRGIGPAILRTFGDPVRVRVLRYDLSTIGDDGHAVQSSPREFFVQAVVQPDNGRRTVNSPQGERNERMICLFTRIPLRAASTDGPPADEVIYQEETFRVKDTENWSQAGYHFSKARRGTR